MSFHAGFANGFKGINPPQEKPWHLTTYPERDYARGWRSGDEYRQRQEYLSSLSTPEWTEPN